MPRSLEFDNLVSRKLCAWFPLPDGLSSDWAILRSAEGLEAAEGREVNYNRICGVRGVGCDPYGDARDDLAAISAWDVSRNKKVISTQAVSEIRTRSKEYIDAIVWIVISKEDIVLDTNIYSFFK